MLFKSKTSLKELFILKNFVRNKHVRSKKRNEPKQLLDEVCLRFVGNGAVGNPRSVFLCYNDKYFMFNCEEGTQRRLSDFGMRPSKIDHFFMTSPNFYNINGISSFLLSRYDSGCFDLGVTGINSQALARQLLKFDSKSRRMNITFRNITEEYKYKSLTIKPIIASHSKNSQSLIYTGTLEKRLAVGDLERCFHANVPRNLVKNLENGETITLANGNIVRPEDCCYPEIPKKKFAFLECSSMDMLKHTQDNDSIMDFLTNCDFVVHFSYEKILFDEKYQRFLDILNKQKNFVISESNPPLSLYSTLRFQKQLNLIDPEVFPNISEAKYLSEDKSLSVGTSDKFIRCLSGSAYYLWPNSHSWSSNDVLCYECLPKLNMDNVLLYNDGNTRPGVVGEIEKLKEKQALLKPSKESYPEFIFLGTASSFPLPIRNSSGILVNLTPDESILLDCGENTYGQLVAFYGVDQICEVLRKIKLIFVSHHHTDHHLGLIKLIQEHFRHTGEKVHVILPRILFGFMNSIGNMCLGELKHQFSPTFSKIFLTERKEVQTMANKFCNSIENMNVFPVLHCAEAFGIRIKTKNGFSFVYSGDTRPCESLINSAKNCDLLIHEATVEDKLQGFAELYFHSTLSEAINVSKQCNAKFTILTHFSQRYGKLPFLPDIEDSDKVAIAFDYMKISPKNFERLPLIRDSLAKMYFKHLENLQLRSDTYQFKNYDKYINN